jgi:UDP-2,3-diacylglucosamine pyrophosphatase LpxH
VAARRIKLIVNDFHLGKGALLKDGTVNILEDFRYGAKFAEYLSHYSTGEYADCEVELIINGDFLNLLQIDYLGIHSYLVTERMVTHAVRAIIAGHADVFDALQKFAAVPNHSIAYIIGNHDIGLLFDDPRRVMRETIGRNLRFYDTYYEFDNVRVEHGHMYEAINATDPQRFILRDPDYPEPVLNLPWASLFVAMFLPKIKKERPFVDKVKPFTGYLRWAVMHDTLFAFRTGFFIAFSFLRMFSLARKHPLLDFRLSFARMKGTTIYPSFVKEARKILRTNPHLNAIIFGHTHVMRYRQWGGGKEYLNTGTWNEVTSLDIADFGLQTVLTYGYIELPPPGSGQRARIRLKEWKGQWRPEVETSIMPVGK